jgi:hypothetical protein
MYLSVEANKNAKNNINFSNILITYEVLPHHKYRVFL